MMYVHGSSSTRPVVKSFGGGFVVSYPHFDSQTLHDLRRYQSDLHQRYPEWMSRLELDQARGLIRVYVFPKSELPRVILTDNTTYSTGYYGE